MAECTFHSGTAAAGNCVVCGRPFCRACLIETSDGKLYCRGCAYSARTGPEAGASGAAVSSMVLSLVSIFICPVTAIPGMIMGFVELGKIKRGQSAPAGNGFALAGAIIGTVVTALTVLGIVFFVLVVVIAAIADA